MSDHQKSRIKPYTIETEVPGAEILRITRKAPMLDQFKYLVRFPECGHQQILTHKSLRNRIRLGNGGTGHQYTGLCGNCSRNKGKRLKTTRPKLTETADLHVAFLKALAYAGRHTENP